MTDVSTGWKDNQLTVVAKPSQLVSMLLFLYVLFSAVSMILVSKYDQATPTLSENDVKGILAMNIINWFFWLIFLIYTIVKRKQLGGKVAIAGIVLVIMLISNVFTSMFYSHVRSGNVTPDPTKLKLAKAGGMMNLLSGSMFLAVETFMCDSK
jgi:hypothetical protein